MYPNAPSTPFRETNHGLIQPLALLALQPTIWVEREWIRKDLGVVIRKSIAHANVCILWYDPVLVPHVFPCILARETGHHTDRHAEGLLNDSR